jgi:cytochrome c-type biogenesis protein CcmH
MNTFAVIAGLFLAVAMAFTLVPLTRLRPVRRSLRRPTHDGVNVCVHRDQIRELERDLAAGSITQLRYEEEVRDIERRLIDDTGAALTVSQAVETRAVRHAALAVVIAIPVLAAALYLAVGTPQALLPIDQTAGAAPTAQR